MLLRELIAKVREIDRDAADYLENEAPKLKSYIHRDKRCRGRELISIMIWSETPQGVSYWSELAEKLELLSR